MPAIQFTPQVWERYVQNALPYHVSMMQYGIVYNDPNPLFTQGDEFKRIPKLRSMDTIGDLEQITPTGTLTPAELQSYSERGVIVRRAKVIQDSDLSRIISGVNAIEAVGKQMAEYNARQIEKTYASVIRGVFGVAAFQADHELTTATIVDSNALIDTKTLLGESAEQFTTIIMHPRSYAALVKQGLVSYVAAATFGQQILLQGTLPTFLGMRILVNEVLCAPTGTDFPTYLVGGQPFYLGYQRGLRFETDRDITTGDGVDILKWSMHFCPHVAGLSWVGAMSNPTDVQLAAPANWSLVEQHPTSIKLSRLIHKVA